MKISGPHRIQSNGQVGVPVKMLRAAGLAPGKDEIFFEVRPELDGILMVPTKTVEDLLEAGRTAPKRKSKRAR